MPNPRDVIISQKSAIPPPLLLNKLLVKEVKSERGIFLRSNKHVLVFIVARKSNNRY